MKVITNGKVYLDGKFESGKIILFDEKIIDIFDEDEMEDISSNDTDYQRLLANKEEIDFVEEIDAKGRYIVPGFVDVHIHGYDGFDAMDGQVESIRGISKGIVKNGVTSFLPTTMTMSKDHIRKALEAIRQYMNEKDDIKEELGADVVGIHLEGPFINVEKKGAQNGQNIQKANYDLIDGYLDLIKVMTIAPEFPENMGFIEKYSNDIAFSLGHSTSSFATAQEAYTKGARSTTHLFNAMTGIDHRQPGLAAAALTFDCYTELIADTIHVSRDLYPMILKAKGSKRLALITDAMRGAGLADGKYDLGGQEVTIVGNKCLLPGNVLAGSVLKLNEGIKNFKEGAKLSLEEVLPCATLTPARLARVDDRKGSLEIGKDADIVIIDKDINIYTTIVGGEVKYENL